MISSNDLRPGITIEIEGEVWSVVEFQHVKPGKGAAFVRSRLKNVKTGNVIERTFRAGEKMARANLEKKEMQFMYGSGDEYHFMDQETYDQIAIPAEKLGEHTKWLKEGMIIEVVMFQGAIIGIDLPNFVELRVVETPPGVKGDTASGGGKPATLETGAVVNVPFFVNIDDVIRIDTRSGQYLDRA
ncbi:MAG: elongation factor P [Cyanobacteria bacterium NC_groundwater_1444_Ag_S-0.65um_54_12]|nr:elongation factor P [Cyanobacteria bacterium NC_groundwater_1444_Ag_S-0.65um_54_12]